MHNGGAEPLISRRRPMSDLLASSGDALGRVPSGYMDRHARTVWFGTGEARLASLVSKDRRYKPVGSPTEVSGRPTGSEYLGGRRLPEHQGRVPTSVTS